MTIDPSVAGLDLVLANLRVAHCCRDWPVNPVSRMGRCGLCGERPTLTDKPIEDYMAERAAIRQGDQP